MSTRRLPLFIVSVATCVGGLYLLVTYLLGTELPLEDRIQVRFGIAGAILTALGLCLLWAGFIAPLFGIKGPR